MAEGERATGTPNTIYDLASVLFHSLEGGASYDKYIEDAEQEGDEELAEFFRRVREEDRDRTAAARLLIAERTLNAEGLEEGAAMPTVEGAAAGVSSRTRPSSVSPEEGDFPPRRAEEGPSPRPEPSDDFPGTEPLKKEVSRARTGEVPLPEEVPPERAGEVPMAEEVPPPRTEEVPMVEEISSGTPPQAPPGKVHRETSPSAR